MLGSVRHVTEACFVGGVGESGGVEKCWIERLGEISVGLAVRRQLCGVVHDGDHVARARDVTRKLAARERETDFRAPLGHRSPVNEKPKLGGVEFGEPSTILGQACSCMGLSVPC